ncbi:ATP-binding protein, partial [Desulfobacterales bacterium HSG17]|nr:ATP-binding protein [Desulfobacterales bacterium HSG17]
LVLASNHKGLIGSRLNNAAYLNGIKASEKVNSRIIITKNMVRSFEVYRYFRPISGQDDDRLHNLMKQMMLRRGISIDINHEWCYQSGKTGVNQVIIVGLDPKPFEEGHKEDIRNTVIISAVLVVLGLAAFISMFWLQSYRSTRKSLQDTSAIAHKVVTSLPVGLIATDKDGNIAFFNSSAERITGLNLEASQGKAPDTILPAHLCRLKEALDRGESIYEKEMVCEFTKSKIVPVSVSASEIINEVGEFVGQVLIIRDLGEVRRLQDEIRRKEKLAAIGELAAGVAHEIRNPLSSIKGIASYFKNKYDEDKGDEEMSSVMIYEVDRLNRVISELLEFARPTDIKPEITDINPLILHTVRLIEKEASLKEISIKLDLPQTNLLAEIDSDRFSQCLLNLYLNSLQAMKKDGLLSIKASKTGTSFIIIEIKDTGPGIRSENLSKIFDPYYTTKTKGTGLGLAIVHRIIESHNGNIKVQSTPGQCTVFTINIPGKKV